MAGHPVRPHPRSRCRSLVAVVIGSSSILLPHPTVADDNPVSAVIFGSLDAGPSGFTTAGAKFGVDRVDRQGFAVLASAGTGRRAESGPAVNGGPAPTLMRQTVLGAALVGYQWFRDWGVMALYAGPEGSMEMLSGPGGTRVLPARIGLRLHGEVWARPTDDTLATATLILGSARGDVWGRLSHGTRLWGAYLGPEIALYADRGDYRKWSFGVHATDFSIRGFSFRASAGYLVETGPAGGSPYVALSVWRSL